MTSDPLTILLAVVRQRRLLGRASLGEDETARQAFLDRVFRRGSLRTVSRWSDAPSSALSLVEEFATSRAKDIDVATILETDLTPSPALRMTLDLLDAETCQVLLTRVIDSLRKSIRSKLRDVLIEPRRAREFINDAVRVLDAIAIRIGELRVTTIILMDRLHAWFAKDDLGSIRAKVLKALAP